MLSTSDAYSAGSSSCHQSTERASPLEFRALGTGALDFLSAPCPGRMPRELSKVFPLTVLDLYASVRDT